MLKIIIGANSGIYISPKMLEVLKERRIEFTLELDLLSNSFIEVELDNKTIVLESENELMKLLNNIDDKKDDDFTNGSYTHSSNNVLSNKAII
ncbi:hypothetical protein [Sulfurisphaera javensis]